MTKFELEGYEARQNKISFTKCPYRYLSIEFIEWNNGWDRHYEENKHNLLNTKYCD